MVRNTQLDDVTYDGCHEEQSREKNYYRFEVKVSFTGSTSIVI